MYLAQCLHTVNTSFLCLLLEYNFQWNIISENVLLSALINMAVNSVWKVREEHSVLWHHFEFHLQYNGYFHN